MLKENVSGGKSFRWISWSLLSRSPGEVSPLHGGTRQGFVSHPPIQISPQMSRGLPHQRHHTHTHTHATHTQTHRHWFDPPPTLFVMKSNTWKRRSGPTTCASNCSAFADTDRRDEEGRGESEMHQTHSDSTNAKKWSQTSISVSQ